jgi:hypothetical protein
MSIPRQQLVACAQQTNRISYEIKGALLHVENASPSILGAQYLADVRRHLEAALKMARHVESLNPMPEPADE